MIDPRDTLIEQLEKSGIPAAVRRQRKINAVLVEFNGSLYRLAEEIVRLRETSSEEWTRLYGDYAERRRLANRPWVNGR
jgi:hypothetical protein